MSLIENLNINNTLQQTVGKDFISITSWFNAYLVIHYVYYFQVLREHEVSELAYFFFLNI